MKVEAGPVSDAKSSDVVLVAVPMESVVETSIEVGQAMREGTLLAYLSSVKTGIADRISSRVPPRVEYVSIHPLFGPAIDHMKGQNIIAVPFKTGQQWKSFAQALRKAGVRVHLMSSEHHDRVMGYVQGMHHFALLSLGMALRKWNGELKTASIAGTLLDNWDTIVGIQG
jgi:prephenate dehydrogenase